MNRERTHARHWALVVAVVAVSAAVAVGVALATPGEGTVGTILNRGSNPADAKVSTGEIKFKTDGPTDILMVTQTWQPGGHSGWHTHSGLVLFTLKSGDLSVFNANCVETKLSAGQAFVEPVGEPMEVKNYGATPAVAYFTIVTASGVPGRDDAPSPGCVAPPDRGRLRGRR